MLTKTIIGLDVGRSAVKVVAYASGLYYRLTFPSLVSPAFPINDETTARRAELETVEVLGKRYFTGDTARLQGGVSMSVGLSHDWTNGPEYLALVASTMKRLAAQGVPGLDSPYIVLGTPASLFGRQKELLAQRTQEVVAAEMKVLPQPMGAYCNFFMDARGVPIKDRQKRPDGKNRSWAVVEVGHYTTDFLLMREGNYIERAAVSCEGVHFAAENLVRILAAKDIQATPLTAEEALRTGVIIDFGERRIEAQVAEAVDHVVQKIMTMADSVLSNDVRSLDGVLLAGGGAPILAAALQKKWPHTVLLDSPRMAVADGFCRYGVGQMIRRAVASEKASA